MKNVSIIAKVIIYVSILGFSCIFIMGYVSIDAADRILTQGAFDRITSINNMKKVQTENFFHEKFNDLSALAEMPGIKKALSQFNKAYSSSSSPTVFVKSKSVESTYQQVADEFSSYIAANEYSNLYLINPDDGLVCFSLHKEDDFGRSLKNESGILADLWKKCRSDKNVHLTDMAKTLKSDAEAFMFFGRGIYENKELLGVVAFQVSSKTVNKSVHVEDGLGENGETFLVGSDYLIRSDLRFSKQSTILELMSNTEATRGAFKGDTKAILNSNYQDIKVLSSFARLDVPEIKWAIVTEVKEDDIMSPKRALIKTILYVCMFIGTIMMPILWIIGRSINKPIKKTIVYAEELATGDLSAKLDIYQKDESGQLAGSLRKMQESLQQKLIVANQIAEGDLSLDVQPVSEKDELGAAMLNMQNSLKSVVKISKDVAKGDYSVILKPKSANDDLSTTLSEMTRNLREMSSKNERQNWIKTGVNGLNDKTRGDLEIQELAKNIVTFLSKYLDAPIGALYLPNDDATAFNLAASYAFTHRKGFQNSVKPGEGLIGQAAVEKELISLLDVPEDYIRIGSALGNQVPRNIIALPFVFDGDLYGLIELGSFKEFTDIQIEFLQTISENVAIALNTANARKQMKLLLAKTQDQANELQHQQEELQVKNEELREQTEALQKSEKELQTQQEELRVSNEELEEQAKALKHSEQELQAQQEELRVINEELEEKTKSLEIQKSEIVKKNEDLEEAHNQIKNKAKELEITSKYKSEFLANMSHELRTPLNSLLILSQDLANNANDHLSEDEIESAEIINKSGHDLLNLINEILDLSKIESGKMLMNFEAVNLADLIDKSRRNFKRLIEEKGLTFNIEISEKLPKKITTDSQRLDQIIKNLLSNSTKFTSEGEITLSCSMNVNGVDLSRSGLDPKKAIVISVKDTGIGIPKEKQREIFEAFQQADGSTSRKFGGTGLGLSISKELARLLGGELQLESEPGNGATFSLYLPLEKVNGQDNPGNNGNMKQEALVQTFHVNEPVAQIADKAEHKTPTNIQSIPDDRHQLESDKSTILIVEDDLVFAKTLYKQCKQNGFNCLATSTGEEGLALAEEFDPNAIILDIKLPGIDGYTVLERLKSNAATRHIPVHMMSSYDETMDVYKMGAIGYLSKPVSAEQLSQTFGKLEDYINKDIKNLLLVEDDSENRRSIKKLIGENDVHISEAETGTKAIELLKSGHFDCMILDLGLPDMSGFELLDLMEKENLDDIPPVIVHTGRDLSQEENAKLQQYTNSIIIKGAKSEERLLDETALFLHRVVADMPKIQQKIIKNLHNKEEFFKDKNILIVDDDMRNVFALSKILEAKGMKISKAVNGQMALDLVGKNGGFDLVLMDIMMPVMDGYEAMRKIREDSKLRNLPIIALTAKAMKNDREKCIEAGASDYLTKPVNVEQLLSLMRVWLYK